MKRAARVDSNQARIVQALIQCGATVLHLHAVGSGCVDIAVGFRGKNYFLEVKTKRGKLNAQQKTWHDNWRGHVAVVRTIDEALQEIGAI